MMQEYLTCPGCGEVLNDYLWMMRHDGDTELGFCNACHTTFDMKVAVTIRYETTLRDVDEVQRSRARVYRPLKGTVP